MSTCPWTFRGKLKFFQNKTLRYPGSYAQLKTMRDLGLFSETAIKVVYAIQDACSPESHHVLLWLESSISLLLYFFTRCAGDATTWDIKVI